jgi:dienelactone hydrolase
VTAHRHRLTTRTLTRQWLSAATTHKTLTLTADRIFGNLYLPPAGTPRHPAVLLLGGSEGKDADRWEAALLASHGYTALSVAYFAEPGLPSTLQNIPLEYFTRAARLLAAQPGTDPAHLIVQGYSRGSEAALLLGQHYPDLFHGVIVYSPSAQANSAFPAPGGIAWTDHGQPILPGTIPTDHINGPVLAIAGTQDHLWPSATWARQIMTELDQTHDPFPHQALVYPGAGHGVGTFPYLPAGIQIHHPITGQTIDLGEPAPPTPPPNSKAGRNSYTSWPPSATEAHRTRTNKDRLPADTAHPGRRAAYRRSTSTRMVCQVP